jgi:hypothetical protein
MEDHGTPKAQLLKQRTEPSWHVVLGFDCTSPVLLVAFLASPRIINAYGQNGDPQRISEVSPITHIILYRAT